MLGLSLSPAYLVTPSAPMVCSPRSGLPRSGFVLWARNRHGLPGRRGPVSGLERKSDLEGGRSVDVKVCGRRPHDGGAADTGGRRTQTSKGGNCGRCGGVGRQTLWGFRCWRSVADVRWTPVWNTTDEARSPVGRSRHAESESRSGGRTTRRLSMVARGRA